MAHVEALSRQVNYLEIFPIERELEFRQLQDAKLKEIANELEYNDSEKFELIQGLVYKKGTDRARFIVSDIMLNNLIRIYHNEMAHCGLEKTYQGIQETYWFPSMRKKIKEYIENCVTCLIANASPNRFEGELQSEYSPKSPFEIIHIDHFGPLQETNKKYKYVFEIIDAFSRYTWFFPKRQIPEKYPII